MLKRLALVTAAVLGLWAALAAPASATTQSFTTPGTSTWTPLTDISSAGFEVNGAAGGLSTSTANPPGGPGGATAATLSVSPGVGFQIVVGAAGSPGTNTGAGAGGSPGGAMGGAICVGGCTSGGGGGGASIVALGSAGVVANWVLLAGGGGGAGVGSGRTGGAGGGLTGQDAPSPVGGCGGQGANQNGTAGSGLQLDGSVGTSNGGGGGGGFYGGGGGSCGGGGGSGFIAAQARAGTFPTPSSLANGSVAVTYYTLTVTTSGPGTVTGSGIDCGGAGHTDCTESFAPGDPIALTATPEPGFAFGGFAGGGCPTSPCSVSLSDDTTLGAAFVVPDTVPPETTITSKPPKKTKKKSVSFAFESSEPGSSFECKLDDGAFSACSSPVEEKAKRHKHTFSVRAIDAAGNIDQSPAEATWKVKKKRKKP
jgi:hypothetical protein